VGDFGAEQHNCGQPVNAAASRTILGLLGYITASFWPK